MDCEDSSSSSSTSSSPLSIEHLPAATPSPKRRAGRKKFRETRHPIYRGVRERNGGKWVCEVREPCKKNRIWLGTFPSPEMAARAHDVAAIALRGKSALLNFPDSAWGLPRAESAAPGDIRKAASKAAEMFRCCEAEYTSPSVSRASADVVVKNATSKSEEGEGKSEGAFVDEEALFNMPGLLDSMAEGLMLTPLGMRPGFDWDAADCHVDMFLWTD